MGTTIPLLRTVWQALGSTRLAVILLAALLIATLLTSLLPQMPDDPAVHEAWLSAVTLRYGHTTRVMQTLGLFRVYHAAWYLVLLVALLLNTLACTLQRLPRLWRAITGQPRVTQPETFYHGFAHRSEWPVSSLQAGLSTATELLSKHRYHSVVEQDEAGGHAALYADRGRWAQAGTLITHIATLLLVIAVVSRPALSWQEAGVILLPGQAHTLDPRSPLTLQVGSVMVERHPGGESRSYQANLAALVENSVVVSRTVRPNHAFSYRGVTVHLQGYGPAVHVATPEETHDLALTGSQPLELSLPEAGLVLRLAHQPQDSTLLLEALRADGTLLGTGTVIDGQQIQIQGIPITFTLSHYTTWQVSHDPTFGLAAGAAGVMLVGVLVSLWVPYRRLWLRVDDHQAQMVGAGDFTGDFEALAGEMATESSLSEDSGSWAVSEGSNNG